MKAAGSDQKGQMNSMCPGHPFPPMVGAVGVGYVTVAVPVPVLVGVHDEVTDTVFEAERVTVFVFDWVDEIVCDPEFVTVADPELVADTVDEIVFVTVFVTVTETEFVTVTETEFELELDIDCPLVNATRPRTKTSATRNLIFFV